MEKQENNNVPLILKKYGVVKKIIQKPTPDDHIHPYWASMHEYDTNLPNWGKFSIKLQSFEQSGYTHYFGVIELGVADLICCVPSLPEATNSLEIAKRTIAGDATDQYQRPIKFERIDNLEHYLSEEPNIVNPIILHIPRSSKDNSSAIISQGSEESTTLEIDLSKIPYIQRNGKDVDPGTIAPDHRPIDLVDGQHRVRASRTSENATAAIVPFVLLDASMDRVDAARIFAEVNVQQEALKPLHKLHLRYVMELASHDVTEDFGRVDESYTNMEDGWETDKKMRRRYANRMAYRIGAKLTFDPQSPLHGLIQQYSSKGEMVAIDAKDWVEYVHEWIISYYTPEWKEERVIQIIRAYFDAWKLTANTDPRTGKFFEAKDLEMNNRWGKFQNNAKGKNPKSKAFTKASFKAFMSLYPTAIQLSGVHGIDDYQEMVSAFLKVLTPCQAIDFIDEQSWSKRIIYKGLSPKKSEMYLYHWMAWSILQYQKTGTTPPVETVWNSEEGTLVDSKPGQGFFSPVNPDHFKGSLQVTNMNSATEIAGTTIGITADALPNESFAKTISISYIIAENGKMRKIPLQNSGTQRKGPHKGVGANFHTNQFSKAQDQRKITAVQIRITSGNIMGSETDEVFSGTYTLRDLYNMNNQRVLLTNSSGNEFLDSDEIPFTRIQSLSMPDREYIVYNTEEQEEESKVFPRELDLDYGPFPPNKISYHDRGGYTIQSCMHCDLGNDHKCGLQRG